MSDPRISHIELDQRTIIWRNADIEQERRIAIFDILEGNYFAPQRQHECESVLGHRMCRIVAHVRHEDAAAASGGKVDFQGATSLAAWRAAQGQELLDGMAVGVFADPKLTQPGGGRVIGDPLKLVDLSAYRLQAGSPAMGAGLDPRRLGFDPGPRDFYGTPLPPGVGYDIGAQQFRR